MFFSQSIIQIKKKLIQSYKNFRTLKICKNCRLETETVVLLFLDTVYYDNSIRKRHHFHKFDRIISIQSQDRIIKLFLYLDTWRVLHVPSDYMKMSLKCVDDKAP